ncbi:gas vesicle protein [Streptomyces spiroverticillatus]|uniref:Gas vesicle protein n=1 Tax=Streptomyces finlayi TaxID=67296 RepID=A0A919CAZ4_9ACTN|nr:GvpL/GvpF family gas vesicle protein [Streptomyces finlayi]GHA13395.1 gas vesicle protein [Streptomyces spiroverticillatus]GHC97966.1 gas vesicle protein [Streptomyces finlayi]
MSTYVYGITRASHPALPEQMGGVGDPPQPVYAIKTGELTALVSESPENLRPKRRDLLAHQSVLSEAGAQGAVLPMRFGSVSTDDETVKNVLAEREKHYLERLDALEGKVEYNVKATHDEEAVLHQVLATDSELRTLNEANRAAGGGTYEQKLALGERVVAAVQQREKADGLLVRQALEGSAADTNPGPESTGWLANVSFLVERDKSADFVEAVDALQREAPHLVLQVNGPLPPYSFVE